MLGDTMMKKLTAEQVVDYRRDGFLAAQTALDVDEIVRYRAALEAHEAVYAGYQTGYEEQLALLV